MERFVKLCINLRFDGKRARANRRVSDIFLPIRDLTNKINRNLQMSYNPSENLTIDEQLVPWRGRCPFLQYLPSKPDKYGVKLFHICNSKTSYPLQRYLT
ncbi:PiggyBac transposable element-derived protein 4 [Elysia marginata]|uniref:PiggyBac transposable element-derived protein 4 n=1 Tax=Elysia marginata TaxID=1093978 RepID=A0AAV4INN7_9GAST|nr:PiggyBac transposable element-derived protein 4 [Elysia marginata]